MKVDNGPFITLEQSQSITGLTLHQCSLANQPLGT